MLRLARWILALVVFSVLFPAVASTASDPPASCEYSGQSEKPKDSEDDEDPDCD